ncbi:MAG: hypothetical protein CSA35_07095 [Dethiosulfovibrio peptidovorans]|nr:MAG: hypothetical protein CSA35_07095 [Dethiosulfovibrio peptidovorans]
MKTSSLAAFVALGSYSCSALVRHLDLPAKWNQGVAFSIGGGFSSWAVMSGFVVLVVLSVSIPWRSSEKTWGLAFLWGGAVANLMDRLLYGAVMDYIPVPWPGGLSVNAADGALGIGVVLLAWDLYRRRGVRPAKKNTP